MYSLSFGDSIHYSKCRVSSLSRNEISSVVVTISCSLFYKSLYWFIGCCLRERKLEVACIYISQKNVCHASANNWCWKHQHFIHLQRLISSDESSTAAFVGDTQNAPPSHLYITQSGAPFPTNLVYFLHLYILWNSVI